MNFKTSSLFDKQFKQLAKKYNLIKVDLKDFTDNFEEYHSLSTSIKNNIYKIRVANSNKNKGKSAGYRIYYYLKVKETTYLLTIYDKSQFESIDEDILMELIKELGEDI
ncbi:MAG: hypothetical protein WC144_03750 [Sulfurimonas sp.]